jgi:hypothetical protein
MTRKGDSVERLSSAISSWFSSNSSPRVVVTVVVVSFATILILIGLFLYTRYTYAREISSLKKSLSKINDQKGNIEFILSRRTRENNIMRHKISKLANGTSFQKLEVDFSKSKKLGESSPLVIIMPFIKSQVPRIKESLRRWSLPKYAPLDLDQPDYDNASTDLVFYFNKGPDEEMAGQIRAIVDEFDLRRIFRDMYFYYANLSDDDDRYPIATSHMFYKLIDDDNLRRRYHYMFYMEPDVLVIKKGWLQALHALAFHRHKPFFVMGSINRGKWVNIPEHRMHINGNALYSLSDAYRDFLVEIRSNIYFVFDLDQYMYLMAHFDRQQEFWHKFVFDDFIMNMYKTTYSEKQIIEENPYTVRYIL